MKFQKILSFVFVVVCGFLMQQNVSAQNDGFPLNFNSSELENALENGYDVWHYQAASLSGTVMQVEKGKNGHPYFLVEMDKKQIWIYCNFDASSGVIIKGDKVKVLGFLSRNKTSRSYYNSINTTNYLIVAMAVKNDTNGEFTYNENETKDCMKWKNGNMPDPRYP